eukprot:2557647-Rhodomonas_salina.1
MVAKKETAITSFWFLLAASFLAGCLFSSLLARTARAVKWGLQLGVAACDALQESPVPALVATRQARPQPKQVAAPTTTFVGPQGATAALSSRDLYL